MKKTGISLELNNLEAQMDGEIAHLESQRKSNLLIGLVIMVIIFGYFYFMSLKVRQLMEPGVAAEMASQQVVSYLPELRISLEKTARQEAPLLIDTLINTLLNEGIPTAHNNLKTLILSTADEMMDNAETDFFNLVNQQLKLNGPTLRTFAADLNTPKGAKDLENAIFKTLEDVMQDPSVQSDLMGYGYQLEELDRTLLYLSQENTSMTPVEESARELIAILRELMNRARHAT
jgi:hypothetical protein